MLLLVSNGSAHGNQAQSVARAFAKSAGKIKRALIRSSVTNAKNKTPLSSALPSASTIPSAMSQIGKTVKATVVAAALATTVVASTVLAQSSQLIHLPDNGGELPEFIVEYRNRSVDVASVKELSVGFDLGKQFLVGTTVALLDQYDKDDNAPYHAKGYLRGQMLVSGDGIRFPNLKASVFYSQFDDNEGMFYDSGGDSYDHPGIRQVIGGHSSLGYEWLDFRGSDAKGFTANHFHLLGFTVGTDPKGDENRTIIVFKSATGLNDIGIVKLGNFNQDDLQAWAGKDEDFSYVLMHEGSVGLTFTPKTKGYDSDYRPEGLVVGLEVRDLRTIGGDIDWEDGTDGDFTAVWNDITLALSQELATGKDHSWYLQAEARFYRQAIGAKALGKTTFNSNEKGARVSASLQLQFDGLHLIRWRPWKNTPAYEITRNAPASGAPYYKYYDMIPDDWKQYYPHLKPPNKPD